MKKIFFAMSLFLSLNALEIGEIVPTLLLEGNNGGQIKNNMPWNSDSLRGKITAIFYVDPDEKDMNSKFSKIIDKKNYNQELFLKVAIINLAATWKPNFVIEKLLASHLKDFPNNLYLKDKKSVLVNKWHLKDDSSDVLLVSKEGKLLFYKDSKMSDKDIDDALKIIERELKRK